MFDKKEDKLIVFITQLMKLTIKKDIKWKEENAPSYLTEGTDDNIPIFFTTTYKHKEIGLFIRRCRQYSGEFDTLYWTEETKIAIVEDSKVLWENRKHILALRDLFYHVQEQVSGLDDLLDELID